MQAKATAGLLAALLLTASGPVAFAQTPTKNPDGPASAASAGSPKTVGAMQGVPPTPAMGSSATAPKLVRHTPGKGAVTQPEGGASAAATGASSANDTPAGK
jgi:hypothetical protein